MPNSAKFVEAAADVKNLKNRPKDSELLELYGLYKQATLGDAGNADHSFLDLKAKAKYEAWKKLIGMSLKDAESKYIELATKLISAYS